jgi:hypothetical protein
VNLSNKPSESLSIFIPKSTQLEDKNDSFKSAEYLSMYYSQAIAPCWFLINLAAYLKTRYVKNRIETLIYIKKNSDSLFLKKSLQLKKKLTSDWLVLHHISNDFSEEILKHRLFSVGIPNALKHENYNKDGRFEFKKDLLGYAKYTTEELKKTFDELLEVFKQISEDNNTRSNMRLQRLLFWFAIVGIGLTIYSSNVSYFNPWIKYIIENLFELKILSAP